MDKNVNVIVTIIHERKMCVIGRQIVSHFVSYFFGTVGGTSISVE